MLCYYGPIAYLRKCVRQFGVHSSCSFTVEDCSLDRNYGLYSRGIASSKEENSSIGSSQKIDQVLLRFSVYKIVCNNIRKIEII